VPELSKFLDCCGHLMRVRIEYLLVLSFRGNNVISGGIVKATQKIQRIPIILVQFAELLG
jgi:hypothetical protein